MDISPSPSLDEGFYRRPLPGHLIPFASEEGRRLFREALADGFMEGWFALAEQFHTQADPAFCALGTLVVALNALGIDPGRFWKGPWRWYSEELLDCCLPLDLVRQRGVTLEQFACLARCNGARADLRRPDTAPLDAFRADLRAAVTSPDGPVFAVAYSRRALGQTGDGHFSPVAGLHPGRDLALVLDVARFKYPPHWVPVPALWEATRPHDPITGRSRGWVLLRRRAAGAAVLFHLTDAHLPWSEAARRLLVELPASLERAHPIAEGAAVQAFVDALPAEVCALVEAVPAPGAIAPEHRAQVDELLATLRSAPLYGEVVRALGARSATCAPEAVALLLLALPDQVFTGVAAGARAELTRAREIDRCAPLLRAEVEILREQMEALGVAGPSEACAAT